MKEKITKRDWETISAYLDGQLSTEKMARFETRLNQDPHLQAALGEMQETRELLRNSPRLSSPRNFILTPAMAGQTHRLPFLAPIFGWSSAFVSLLLIFLMVGDVFSPSGLIPVAGNMPGQEQMIAHQEEMIQDRGLPQQPSAAEGLNRLEIESPQDAEVLEQETMLEVAAEPILESDAVEESALPSGESEDVEIFIDPEVTPTELAEEMAVIAAEEEIGFQVVQPEENELVAGEARGDDQVEVLDEVESPEETPIIVETEAVENLVEPPTEVPLMDLKTVPQQDDSIEEPLGDSPESILEGEMVPNIEEPVSQTQVRDDNKDYIFGAEVILGLCALGTGLAWLYVRRRGR